MMKPASPLVANTSESVGQVRNALTIDVEDYYQVTNFERQISRKNWPSFPSRVVGSTQRILTLLDKYNVKATFFILGYVADQHPDLVLDISKAGHEIGSHSYWHRLVYQLTPDEFLTDLRRSRDVLQQLVQKPVVTFRAPSFSITKKSFWALDTLAREGFEVDSSVFPIRHRRYGILKTPRSPHRLVTPSGQLWEFPITVSQIGKRWNVPIAGGGYFRLFPIGVTTRLLQRVNDTCAQPFVFYIHPWEFDPDQPRLSVGSPVKRFRHYVNLSTTARKFELLLRSFRFGRLDEVLTAYATRSHSTVALAS